MVKIFYVLLYIFSLYSLLNPDNQYSILLKIICLILPATHTFLELIDRCYDCMVQFQFHGTVISSDIVPWIMDKLCQNLFHGLFPALVFFISHFQLHFRRKFCPGHLGEYFFPVKNSCCNPCRIGAPIPESSSAEGTWTVTSAISLWNCIRYLFLVGPPSTRSSWILIRILRSWHLPHL